MNDRSYNPGILQRGYPFAKYQDYMTLLFYLVIEIGSIYTSMYIHISCNGWVFNGSGLGMAN